MYGSTSDDAFEDLFFGNADVVDAFGLHVLLLLTVACYLFGGGSGPSRNASFFQQRLFWEEYSSRHERQGTFDRRLRMSKESFDKLLVYVQNDLTVDETKANARGGSIIPEVCLYCTLRYLAGGSYLDVCDVAGISTASFYRVLWKTIRAITKVPELSIDFPTTSQAISEIMEGFAGLSDDRAITNCVGAVDGYLLRTHTPSKKEAGNVRSFFSGHYQCYGLNVQACCDHHSRFTFLAVAAPGVSCDRMAITECSLYSLIESLPFGVCTIGDNAYEPTEHMVTIYHSLDRKQKRLDDFCYYASQLRIRIEMAFGLMQIKWGILQRPLSNKLYNIKDLIQCIGRLHNYVVNERLLDRVKDKADTAVAATNDLCYIPTIPHDHNGNAIELNALYDETLRGYSELRERMVDRVERKALTRPAANRIRNDN